MRNRTTLSDEQYAGVEPLLPQHGNHFKTPPLQVIDSWLDVYYKGCGWRGLPCEFGKWHTIYARLNC